MVYFDREPEVGLHKLRDAFQKNVCFFIKFVKKGGESFPFIKIYVANFV